MVTNRKGLVNVRALNSFFAHFFAFLFLNNQFMIELPLISAYFEA